MHLGQVMQARAACLAYPDPVSLEPLPTILSTNEDALMWIMHLHPIEPKWLQEYLSVVVAMLRLVVVAMTITTTAVLVMRMSMVMAMVAVMGRLGRLRSR